MSDTNMHYSPLIKRTSESNFNKKWFSFPREVTGPRLEVEIFNYTQIVFSYSIAYKVVLALLGAQHQVSKPPVLFCRVQCLSYFSHLEIPHNTHIDINTKYVKTKLKTLTLYNTYPAWLKSKQGANNHAIYCNSHNNILQQEQTTHSQSLAT